MDVLKSAVIVGENAGGKSNFVKSLQYLKTFFKENREVVSSSEYINADYTADFSKMRYIYTAQKFSLSVLINGMIYFYNLELDFLGIKSEKLEIMKKNKTQRQKILMVERTEIEPSLTEIVKSSKKFGFAMIKHEVQCISCGLSI